MNEDYEIDPEFLLWKGCLRNPDAGALALCAVYINGILWGREFES